MSLNQRLASRLRFVRFRNEWQAERASNDVSKSGAKKGPAHRSLWQLYQALYRLMAGRRMLIALALVTLSVATLLRFLPPAATKLVIDNVLLGKAIPTWVPAWVPVPSRPEARLVFLAMGVLAVTVLGTAIGLWGRWQATKTAKKLQVSVRRKVFDHAADCPCTGFTSSRPAAPPASCARTRTGSASWSSACCITRGGPSFSSSVGWSCWPGSTGGSCSARSR